MKIQVVSDLHLEFGTVEISNNGADVLILSGDICVAASFATLDPRVPRVIGSRAASYVSFFEQVCGEFENVIYVLGNHEHYHGNFANTVDILRKECARFTNLHILDIDALVIDGVVFVGGTLWTDFNRGDPIVKWDAGRLMNDFICVDDGPHGYKFLPDTAAEYHDRMLALIETTCAQDAHPVVVVGHHAPSNLSISPEYKNDKLNGAYASNLVDFIISKPQIKLWTHGHMHSSSDYMIGSTRVIANPFGYKGYETNKQFDPGMVIEV